MAEHEPTMTKLEPTMTSLRELSKAFPDSSRRAALLLDAADAIEGLEAENAKLIEIIADLEEMLPENERLHIHESANAIANDNAKLRRLVRDIWEDACQFDGFWDYVHDDGTLYREDELPHYQDRMRELGIEVTS